MQTSDTSRARSRAITSLLCPVARLSSLMLSRRPLLAKIHSSTLILHRVGAGLPPVERCTCEAFHHCHLLCFYCYDLSLKHQSGYWELVNLP